MFLFPLAELRRWLGEGSVGTSVPITRSKTRSLDLMLHLLQMDG